MKERRTVTGNQDSTGDRECLPSVNIYRIYLRIGPTDMRKAESGLPAIVQNEMELNPFQPACVVFCNKTRCLLKVLYWDRTGYAL
jgi:transposase